MVDSGALFTNGIHRKYFVRSQSDRHYLWAGRLSGLAITIIAVLYAIFAIQRVLYSFLLTETAATFVGIGMLLGIFWRRANRWGAASSLLTALAVNFAGYHYTHRRLDSWDPNVFLLAVVSGIIVAVIVSLLTPPEPAAAVEDFCNNLQTPSDGKDITGKRAVDQKSVAEAGRQLILVNLLHLRQGACGVALLRAYRVDLLGFAFGWAMAVLLIIGVVLFFKG